MSFFFQVFFLFATNGKVQLDGYKIECWSCELFFKPFFATNGNMQLDGYKVKCVGLVGYFFEFFFCFCNQYKSAASWLQDRISVVLVSFLSLFLATNGKVKLGGYKVKCVGLVGYFFKFFFCFCNLWKSAAWWLQDRMSVVWASFFFFIFLQPMDKCSLMVTR